MAHILVGLVALLAVVGCTPAAHAKAVTAQSIALQPGDVSGLEACDSGGDMEAVLTKEKSVDQFGYDVNATEWEQWKTQGATEAYFAVYGRTAADCSAFSATGNGAPGGGLMAGLVVKFKDTAVAARNYRAASTLLGFGPRDITFIKLVGGIITTGTDTGLGPQSVIGTASAVGSTYYFAFWQYKIFDSFFIAYDLPSFEAQGAAENVNQRMI
ncbi:MAG: hypothetical protein ACREOY_10635 [Candidatus Dormibacteraceae bacterium]